MKKRYLFVALILCLVALGFVIYALNHPEGSFGWDNSVTAIIYGLYLDAIVLFVILAFAKQLTKLKVLSNVFSLIGIFFLFQSLIRLFPEEFLSWCFPLALIFFTLSLFINLYQIKNNK